MSSKSQTNPKEKRSLLFKHGKPFIRPIQIYQDDEYSRDVGILWAAYKRHPFEIFGPDLDQEQFVESLEILSSEADLLFIEDKNRGYDDKGPIMFLALYSDGWKAQPHAEFFPYGLYIKMFLFALF